MRWVFLQKLALVKRARSRWPTFVTYKEDKMLRNEKWNIKLRETDEKKYRITMWDMTGIASYKFGAADLQRVTFSKYYASNCMKGGVGIHPCGWLVAWLLFVGRISDTEYHRIAGYLQDKKEHQNQDLVQNDLDPDLLEIICTINLLNKGYRSREDTAAEDQLLLQPV